MFNGQWPLTNYKTKQLQIFLEAYYFMFHFISQVIDHEINQDSCLNKIYYDLYYIIQF